MPNWTKEQWEAISEEGSNIIVSAGAGSGKTAVLTARVIRKLKEGIHIDELLILTFTKAAALEMKERIRREMLKENLEEELERLDSAYITTFDSYALSIVKKYHYLFPLPKEIKITESSMVTLEKYRIVDRVFDSYYEKQDPTFEAMMGRFCLKDDKDVRENLYQIYLKLENNYDLEHLLSHYQETYHEASHQEAIQREFLSFLKRKQEEIKDLVFHFPIDDGEYLEKLRTTFQDFLQADAYEDFCQTKSLKIPILPRNTQEEGKRAKEELSTKWKEFISYLVYPTLEEWQEKKEERKEEELLLVSMIQEIHQQVREWKQEHLYFEFHDIAFLAIDLLSENKEVRESLRDHFQEILLDEYQDTNDIQERFISLISNHNVYMVGDIKQSIYRFRNANPRLFQTKYEAYRLGQDGRKIDLTRNFRSRKEPLEDINLLFDQLMDHELGGADYQKEHQMIFGNLTYEEEGKTLEEHHMELWNYSKDQLSSFSKEEVEAFLIGEDIKKKVEEHYPIFDSKLGRLRDATFDDFAILLDRSTSFETYRKIFVFLNIPLTIWKDEVITEGMDLLVLRNLLKLILKIEKKELDSDFRYTFTSVARSFLVGMRDEEISDCFLTNEFSSCELFQKCLLISKELSHLSCELILKRILEEFSYYEKIITIGNVEDNLLRLQYLESLASSMDESGYLIEEFVEYLDDLLKQGVILRYPSVKSNSNSVKMMTIHKSKGLEFPICYFGGLTNQFNIKEIKDPILFSKEYGLILPFEEEGEVRHTMEYYLEKDHYLEEEISEKIRLFYVALTRAKEKIILVTPWRETNLSKERGIVSFAIRKKARSFSDFLESLKDSTSSYQMEKEPLLLSKEYRKKQGENWKQEKLDVLSLSVEELEEEELSSKEVRYSKTIVSLLGEKEKEQMELGKKLHAVLETIDFLHPDVSKYSLSPYYEAKIKSFFQQDFMNDLKHSKWYRELEFYDGSRHGIIDLIIEKEDKLILVDYKLKHTNDPDYLEQLQGYLSYLKKKTEKKIEVYLYSILEERSVPLILEPSVLS